VKKENPSALSGKQRDNKDEFHVVAVVPRFQERPRFATRQARKPHREQ
jgi:hypothetical protein